MRQRVGCVMAASFAVFATAGVLAQGALENPPPGATESGISAITGWHCSSRNIELRIDGTSLGAPGMGTPRADTARICGRSDTGFSYLYNFALLRGGTHRLDAYADGVLFGSATFKVGYLGTEFLTGATAAHYIPDFPARGVGTHVAWSQAKQNYVVTLVEPPLSPSIVGTYSLRHISMYASTGEAMSSLQSGWTVAGTLTYRADRTFSVTFALSYGGETAGTSIGGSYADNGFYLVQNGEVDLVVERGDTLTMHTLAPGDGAWASVVMSATRVPPPASGATFDDAPAPALAVGVGSAIAQLVSALNPVAR